MPPAGGERVAFVVNRCHSVQLGGVRQGDCVDGSCSDGRGVRLDPLVTVDIPTGADLKRLLSLVALLIAFVIAIPLLGQLIASVIFCILLMRCLSDLGWVRIVASSLLVCGGLYVAFVMVLKVPLPGGLLSP